MTGWDWDSLCPVIRQGAGYGDAIGLALAGQGYLRKDGGGFLAQRQQVLVAGAVMAQEQVAGIGGLGHQGRFAGGAVAGFVGAGLAIVQEGALVVEQCRVLNVRHERRCVQRVSAEGVAVAGLGGASVGCRVDQAAIR